MVALKWFIETNGLIKDIFAVLGTVVATFFAFKLPRTKIVKKITILLLMLLGVVLVAGSLLAQNFTIVPDISGYSYEDAKDELRNSNLSILMNPAPEYFRVEDTEPKAGSIIGKQGKIEIYYQVEMPDFKDLDIEDAIKLAKYNNIATSEDFGTTGIVVSQSIPAGTPVAIGTSVAFEVEKYSKEFINDELQRVVESVKQLQKDIGFISKRDEFVIKNNEEVKELVPAKELNFSKLLTHLENLKEVYCFREIVWDMEKAGYPVSGKTYGEVLDTFFNLSYEKKAEVLAEKFAFVGYYHYSQATEYEYYADVKEINGIKEYSNLTAKVINVDNVDIPIFTLRGTDDFGAVDISYIDTAVK